MSDRDPYIPYNSDPATSKCDNIFWKDRTKKYYKGGVLFASERYRESRNDYEHCMDIEQLAYLNPKGEMHGSVIEWYWNGNPKAHYRYVNGVKHGEQVEYREKRRPWYDRLVKGNDRSSYHDPEYERVISEYRNGKKQTPLRKIGRALLNVGAGVLGMASMGWARVAPSFLLNDEQKNDRLSRRQNKQTEAEQKYNEELNQLKKDIVLESGYRDLAKIRQDRKAAKGQKSASGKSKFWRNAFIGVLGYLAIGNGIKFYNDRPDKDKKFVIKELRQESKDIGGRPAFLATIQEGDRESTYQIADNGTVFEEQYKDKNYHRTGYFVETNGDKFKKQELEAHVEQNPIYNKGPGLGHDMEEAGDYSISFVGHAFQNATKGFEIALYGSEWYHMVSDITSFKAKNNISTELEQDQTIEHLKTLESNLGTEFVMRNVDDMKPKGSSPAKSASKGSNWQHKNKNH